MRFQLEFIRNTVTSFQFDQYSIDTRFCTVSYQPDTKRYELLLFDAVKMITSWTELTNFDNRVGEAMMAFAPCR